MIDKTCGGKPSARIFNDGLLVISYKIEYIKR
jgi:hypothetical protein